MGGSDSAPNPVEQLIGALGNCLAVGYAANASAAGITIRDLRIDLDGDLDLHAFLGLADGHAGFSAIRVAVHLDTDADEAAVAELHRRVAATSPVGPRTSGRLTRETTAQKFSYLKPVQTYGIAIQYCHSPAPRAGRKAVPLMTTVAIAEPVAPAAASVSAPASAPKQ